MQREKAKAATIRVQAVDRALLLLEEIAHLEKATLTDLVEATQLHKATAYRLVTSLVDNGYIEQDLVTKQYRLSMKLFELGALRMQSVDFLNVAKSMIQHLSRETGQVVHLVIPYHNEVIYIEKAGEDHQGKMRSRIGQTAPFYCTAVGKAILSTWSNTEISHYLKVSLPQKMTPNTLVTFTDLMANIEQVRQEGVAFDNEEYERGVYCIAAYFSSYKERAAGAISVSLPIAEKANQASYISKVKECSKHLTQLLGG